MSHRRLVAGVFAAGLALLAAEPTLASASPSGATITTQAASAVVEQPILDTATLSGGDSPSGSITWNLYRANTGCATFLDRVSVPVDGDGVYTSPSFTPAFAGTYQWVATYSGDANNSSVSSSCDDTNGQSVVAKATPSLSTTASSNAIGQPIFDTATVSGGDSPTGWITWNLFRANTGCVKSVDPVSVAVHGDGTYMTPPIIPVFAGTYQWVATYSGDTNNNPTSSSCDDINEQSLVSKASPSLSTTASSNTVGQPIDDTATLSGGDSPSGSITWNLYAANTGCLTSLHAVSAPVDGDATYTSPSFTPASAGTYQWVATYSGDTNNNPVASSCTDSNEQSTVTPAPTPPTPPTPPKTVPSGSPAQGGASAAAITPVVKATKVLRCGPHKVKKHRKVHGKRVAVCAKKAKKRRPAPKFTG